MGVKEATLRRSIGRECESGFTLVELLVVCAIITILAGLLLPALTSAKGKAQAIRCSQTARQHALAVVMYAQDFDDFLPPVAFLQDDKEVLWPTLLEPYLKGYLVHRCATDRSSTNFSYGLNERLFADLLDDDDPKIIKESAVLQPVEKVMLGELGTEDDFKTPRPDTFKLVSPSGDLNDDSDARPSTRHTGKCSVGFMDGHQQLLGLKNFYTQQQPKDRYFTAQ